MPTIKEIKAIAKNRAVGLPKKAKKLIWYIYCRNKKEIYLVMQLKNVMMMYVFGIKIAKKL